MKKFFILLCMGALAYTAGAQQASETARYAPDNLKWMHIGSGYPNNINIRAVRDFLKRTKPNTDAEWAQLNTGFVVKYVTDNRRCRTVYNKRGDFIHTIRQYSEKEMAKSVRTVIKSRYFDYTITLVEEVERHARPLTYVVHLEDATSFLNVQVLDGEIVEVDEYTKG